MVHLCRGRREQEYPPQSQKIFAEQYPSVGAGGTAAGVGSSTAGYSPWMRRARITGAAVFCAASVFLRLCGLHDGKEPAGRAAAEKHIEQEGIHSHRVFRSAGFDLRRAAISGADCIRRPRRAIMISYSPGYKGHDDLTSSPPSSVLSTAVSLECSCVATNNRGCARCGT